MVQLIVRARPRSSLLVRPALRFRHALSFCCALFLLPCWVLFAELSGRNLWVEKGFMRLTGLVSVRCRHLFRFGRLGIGHDPHTCCICGFIPLHCDFRCVATCCPHSLPPFPVCCELDQLMKGPSLRRICKHVRHVSVTILHFNCVFH